MSRRDGQRRHPEFLAPADGSIASASKRKGSPCQQDDDSPFLKENVDSDGDSQAGQTIPDLPEDIWHHIRSLMPLCDAARAACLSHTFLHFWRSYPDLTFNEHVFSPKARMYGDGFSHTIDSIIRNHSGIGVKILKLESFYASSHSLSSWLRIAVKPGIEELTIRPCYMLKKKYKFPCSLLSDGVRDSIRYLKLGFCTFRPTAELGPLRSLTSLHLSHVCITEDELECLLSNSLALEELELVSCKGVICLRIPCELQCFSRLRIFPCGLKLIENKAPNLSTLELCGKPKLSLGEALQMKKFSMYHSDDVVCYARTELPSIMPNLDTLELSSGDEVLNTPMLPTKFLCLKHLTICLRLFHSSYDCFSLVSFLDASPSLETLSLDVSKKPMVHESVFGHSSDLREMAEDQHRYLKSVKITGFSCVKGLVELTSYILKNAVSLDFLTLDTNYGSTRRCSDRISGQCSPMGNNLREVRRALVAVRTYIVDKVPARVKLTVVEPCNKCHKL